MKKFLFMLLGMFITLPAFARDFQYESEGQTLTHNVIHEDAKTDMVKEDPKSFRPGNNVSGKSNLTYLNAPFVADKIYVCGNVMTAHGGVSNNFLCPTAGNQADYEKYWKLEETSPGVFTGTYYIYKDSDYTGVDGLPQFRFFKDLSGWISDTSLGSGESDFYCLPVLLEEDAVTYPIYPSGLGNWGTCTSISGEDYIWKGGWVKMVVDSNNGSLTLQLVDSVGSGGDEPNPAIPREFQYEYEGQTLTYTVIDEDAKTCKVKEGTSAYNPGNYVSGKLIIPSIAIDGGVQYTVTSIGDYAFSSCESLTSVKIPESVTSIGNRAFFCCSNLPSITIPNSVTSIGEWAFYSCDALTSIIIPESVTSIGNHAFFCCSNLPSITIPNSVTSIGEWAFGGCDSLTSIIIPESVTSIGENLFFDDDGLISATIMGAVAIPYRAFYYCDNLTTVTLAEGVSSIGEEAFGSCQSLTSITIPGSVTSIGDYAFSYCRSLPSITIPEGVTSIGKQAFITCSSLNSVTIPTSIISIGDEAFDECKRLFSVTYLADQPIQGDFYIFPSGTYENGTLYMSEAGVAASKDIIPWKNFKNIQIFDPSSIEEVIGDFNEDAPYEVFNLNGVKMADTTDNLPDGIYILRQNNTVKKIAVK